MTSLQQSYWANQETIRANKERERENTRSNKAKEAENYRANTTRELETNRANLRAEEQREGSMAIERAKVRQGYATTLIKGLFDVAKEGVKSLGKSATGSATTSRIGG